MPINTPIDAGPKSLKKITGAALQTVRRAIASGKVIKNIAKTDGKAICEVAVKSDAVLEQSGTIKKTSGFSGAAGTPGNAPKKIPNIESIGKQATDWVGKDAKVITNEFGDTIIQSNDGLREIRFDFNHTAPHANPHTHLIEYKMVKNKKVEVVNKRIYPDGVPPE